MTKSKSPRRNASPIKHSNSNSSNTGNSKHSIGAAAAALHAATTATTTTSFDRHSPPPSPKHLRHSTRDATSPPSSPISSSGPTEASKEVKTNKVQGARNDVNDTINLAAKELGVVVENKEFTPMEGRAETQAASQVSAANKISTVDQNDRGQNQNRSPSNLSSSSSSSTSSPFTTVSGSGSGFGRGQGSGSVRGKGKGKGGGPTPSALTYLSNNLFDSLRFDLDSTDKNEGGSESDSESSDDSDLDDSVCSSSSSSSESSNSSHYSEDEEEEEGIEEEEEEADDNSESKESGLDTSQAVGNGHKAGRKKQVGTGPSSLLKRTLKKNLVNQIQEVRLPSPSSSQGPLPEERTLSLKPSLDDNVILQHQAHHDHNHQHQLPHEHHHHDMNHRKGSENEPVVLLADQSAKAKWANWSVRTLWTLIMIGGFFACVAAGPAFVILLVVMVQGLVYKEVIYLAAVPSREKKLPWFRAMNWYFLFSTNYFFYGESLIHYFQHVVFVDAFLLPFATHHRFISFTLYVIGFVFFVANLKKGHYRFQFSQFAWTHMTLLLVVCQSHFIINNIFEGLIWFFLPVSLVIANDIWAYIFGFFWGKTPLIKLSPKKTVEGFVGGWIMTIVFGMMFATLFLRYPYMICPVKDLRATAFSGLTCEPNPVFVPVKHYLKPWMVSLVRHLGLRNNYVMIAPLQLHTIVMACFASLIAPFGGFFASGFKRAFKIKDFGQSIPGHGGITDRMDCQFLMGLFSYMYYQSFIKTSAITVGAVLQSAINNLKGQEQMELFDHLRQYLIGQGLLDEESCVIIPPKEAWIS